MFSRRFCVGSGRRWMTHAHGGFGADGRRVPVVFEDVARAAFRIREALPPTPSRYSPKLSKLLDCEVHTKLEYTFTTGSFKERGARNAVLLLDADERRRGVMAASAGNHAQALALHAVEQGVPCTVVMPTVAPLTKIQNCRDIGADVILEGEHLGESRAWAMAEAERRGMVYVNGYDDPAVIAGAGTLGMEIVEEFPDADAVLVPVGGGGLIAGVSLAVKTLAPQMQVIGVEPEAVRSMGAAVEHGSPVLVAASTTLADGLMVPQVGANAFAVCHTLVDKFVAVDEMYIALAMLRLLEMEKSVVEGGGATGLAALLQGKLPELRGKKVVLPLCGGNVDTVTLGRVIERGLAADGRLVRFAVEVPDRAGAVAMLTRTIADVGVSIREIYHERAFLQSSNLSTVRITFIAETTGGHQAAVLFNTLESTAHIRILEGSIAVDSKDDQVFDRDEEGNIMFSADVLSTSPVYDPILQIALAMQAENLTTEQLTQKIIHYMNTNSLQQVDLNQLVEAMYQALPSSQGDEQLKDAVSKLFGFLDINIDNAIDEDEITQGLHFIDKVVAAEQEQDPNV